MSIELNSKFRKALYELEETNNMVFVTGRAGTGKSTLLMYFRENTKKRVVVLAPTGVAAVNVYGQTVHSFFNFKPNITPSSIKTKSRNRSIYTKIDTIVIDEVSMLRADLLDCVDKFLRINVDPDKPFGGIQMIFIGDLYQLPPVISSKDRDVFSEHYESPYFFSAKSFPECQMSIIELDKVYRQKDIEFVSLLNSIRNNSVTADQLDILNKRLDENFEAPIEDFYVFLTPTNASADEVNYKQLSKLNNKMHTFPSSISGEFGKEYYPTNTDLNIAIGAQVMLLNNDSVGRWVNGTIGRVLNITRDLEGEDVIIVLLENGVKAHVRRYTWEIYKFVVENDELKSESVGSFNQFPMALAWAMTIHKSQGKTFDKVVLDMGRGAFAHGQTYVALSRCTSLDGLILKKLLKKNHVLVDRRTIAFMDRYQEFSNAC